MRIASKSLFCALVGAASLATTPLAQADESLFLAFGVDTRTFTNGTNPFMNMITVADLHGDHYHSFTINNGTNPNGHKPMPFVVNPGGESAMLELAAMNIAPFPTSNLIPNSPVGDFQLELVGLTPGLGVEFVHGNHTHTMNIGSDESLSITSVEQVLFNVDSGIALGRYQADFRIVDDNGHYLSEVDYAGTRWGSNFSILVDAVAVPEPASLGLLGLGGLGLVRRRR